MKKNSGKIFNKKVSFYNKKCAICNTSNSLDVFNITKDIRISKKVTTVICRNCGLVFLNPAPTDESYMSFYKSQRSGGSRSSKYEFLYKKEYLHKLIVQILIDTVPLLKECNTIDVGSGNGAFLHYLKPYVKEVRSLEASENAQKDIPKYFSCEVIDGFDLKSVNDYGKLDLLTSNAVIEHYNNPEAALKDYYNSLKDGGRILLYTHNVKSMSFSAGENAYFKFIHPYYFSPNTLTILVEKVGFSNIRFFDFPLNDKYRSVCSPSEVLPGFFVLTAEKNINTKKSSVSIDGNREVDECTEALERARNNEKLFWFKKNIHRFLALLKISKNNEKIDLYKDAYVKYMQSRRQG